MLTSLNPAFAVHFLDTAVGDHRSTEPKGG
jgi:hypothetical protein